MFALAAFVAHPKLHQNPARAWVLFEMRGEDAVQPKVCESVPQHFLPRLCRIALSPVREAKPVTKFGVVMLVVDAQPDAANLPPVGTQGNRQPDLVRLPSKSQKVSGILI